MPCSIDLCIDCLGCVFNPTTKKQNPYKSSNCPGFVDGVIPPYCYSGFRRNSDSVKFIEVK